ncbi:Aste57867_17013 [Aphanomyces stellatus]|uniref:Aste57867_17013 protein n=1 Tax=Aphanomyces stellatus TaxID=120398 RepID=A0A485L7Y4_9STRA|nr:hypothetical protein As57867_016955 [Aphanomyces stellatus]VFT93774.1 Aste57867_17013 [Aphanomyces stellatus]
MAALDAEAREMLREWLVRTLEPLYVHSFLLGSCDADPSVLSKYVLALVQTNPEKEGLVEVCRSKLHEFLGDETAPFVDRLFATLRTQSYLQKSPRHEATPTAAAPTNLSAAPSGENNADSHRRGRENDDDAQSRNKRPRRSRSRSRSRSPRDHRNDRKLPRDGSRRDAGRGRGGGGRGGMRGGYDGWMPPPHGGGGGPWGMFPRPMYPPMMNPDSFDPNAYNPDSPSMHHHPHPSQYPPHPHHPHHPPPHHFGGPPRRSKANADDAKKPTDDEAATTLRVENVDPKFINMVKLSGHFSRFGEVVNVQMRPDFRAAFVQFATADSARKAFHSPMPVCNNRFISVKFAKRSPKDLGEIDAGDGPTPEQLRAAALETGKKILEEKRQLLEQDKALQKQRETLLQNQLSQHEMLRDKMQAKGLLGAAEQATMDKKIADLSAQLHALQHPVVAAAPPAGPLATLQAELSQLEAKVKHGRRGGGSIDNRTKVLQLTNLPDALRDASVLEQHFATFGTIDQVRHVDTVAYVKFADRYAGEKALKFGQTYNNAPLEMAWCNDPSALDKTAATEANTE